MDSIYGISPCNMIKIYDKQDDFGLFCVTDVSLSEIKLCQIRTISSIDLSEQFVISVRLLKFLKYEIVK